MDDSKPSVSQREILFYTALGLTSSEVSLKVNRSIHTIHITLRDLRRKYRARNTTHLITLAIVKGWLDHDSLISAVDKEKRYILAL